MLSPAPASITALLLASLFGLTLAVVGARGPRAERVLLLVGLALAGFGAAGMIDVLFDLGTFPVGALVAGAALALLGVVVLARGNA